MSRPHHVVIIGGGFSGTALAVHLLRCGNARREITLIESGERLGRGLAYGTPEDAHVLNTCAGRMSLLPEDRTHFVSWLRRRCGGASSDDFVSRRVYGDYVEETFLAALREAGRFGQVFRALTRTIATDVVRLGGRFAVELSSGHALRADTVVLALGHPRPADPLSGWIGPWTHRYRRDPWQANLAAEIAPDDRVLIIGTGLTMVDAVLTLQSAGHRGQIHALSRNGLLPRAHGETQPLPSELRLQLAMRLRTCSDVRTLARRVRQTVDDAARLGIGWHAVFDALRMLAPRLWRSLDDRERRRFVTRLRCFWEVHRHRIAPAPARTIESLLRDGRLEVRAGRVVGAAEQKAGIEIVHALRGTNAAQSQYYDWVLNCTGPSYRPVSRSPLERRLVDRGSIRPDTLGLGYVTAPGGAVVGRRGIVPGLYMLGPASRPLAWESTSVPELSEQAEALAAHIHAERRSVKRPARKLA